MTDTPTSKPKSDGMSFAEEALRLNDLRPKRLTPAEVAREKERCKADLTYFVNKYCQIYDSLTASWVPFKLWPSQVELLNTVMNSKYSLIPKARQLGISWLLGDVLPLWYMLFRPIAEILLFSQREDEAKKLLERIKGTDESVSTYQLLPDWMKLKVTVDNTQEFKLSNGSRIQALPSTAGGRSNAATYLVIDEADFIPNVQKLMTAAKPTIDAGANKMVVLSTINEEVPNSYFQRLCKANLKGDDSFAMHFLGWRAHPDRNDAWYQKEKQHSFNTNGSYDLLFKEYPETLQEALAAREMNTVFPPHWILAVTDTRQPLPTLPDTPAINGLRLYKVYQPGHSYGIGFDPGGGKLDPSVAVVIDRDTKEQIAVYEGLVEPTQAANNVATLSEYYGNAPILFELNNHGHAALAQFKERSANLVYGLNRRGRRDREPGWLTTERTKHLLYDIGNKVLQAAYADGEASGGVFPILLIDQTTVAEMQSINVNTLEAPEGFHDDHALAWVLAQMSVYQNIAALQQVAYSGLWHKRNARDPDVIYRGPGQPEMGTPEQRPTQIERNISKFQSDMVDRIVNQPLADDDIPIPEHIRKKYGRY